MSDVKRYAATQGGMEEFRDDYDRHRGAIIKFVTEADYVREVARLAQLDKILAPTFKIVGDNWMCTNSKSDPLCLYCGELWDNHYVDKEDDTESCIVPKLIALYAPTP